MMILPLRGAIALAAAFCTAAAACAGRRPRSEIDSSGAVALAVIAPEAFRAALGVYIEYRNAEMSCAFFAIEDIVRSSRGGDDAERLKRFLYDLWKRRGLRYALLAGDADTLPVRYMCLDRVTSEAFHYAFYPSDLYYADLAKPDGEFEYWNARKDGFHGGYFGEVRGEYNKNDPINFDDVDYRAEVAVGRWPVSAPEQAAAVAEKVLSYEQSARGPSAQVAARGAIVAVDGWVNCKDRADAWARLFAGGEPIVIFTSGAPPGPEPDNVIKQIRAGVGWIVHTGHGHDDGWEHSLHSGLIPQLKGLASLPIVMSAGCSTARFATLPPYEAYVDEAGVEHKGTTGGEVFTSPPLPPACYQKGKYNYSGFGEKLVREPGGGAVAYIGCNTGSQPCGLTLVDGLLRSMAETAPFSEKRLGDHWSSAIEYYYRNERLARLVPNNDWYPPSVFF